MVNGNESRSSVVELLFVRLNDCEVEVTIELEGV